MSFLPLIIMSASLFSFPPIQFDRIAVTDDLESSLNFSGWTDHDTEDNRSLGVWVLFDFFDTFERPCHVYVYLNGSDQPRFFADLNEENVTKPEVFKRLKYDPIMVGFEWKEGSSIVKPEFQDGPQFGTTYRFFIRDYTIDDQVVPGYNYIQDNPVHYEQGYDVIPKPTSYSLPLATVTIDLPNMPDNAKPLEFVSIPAGTQLLGSTIENNMSPRIVTFSKNYFISKYEVTQAQWKAVRDDNPSHFQGDPDLPVENVSWLEIQDFLYNINLLNLGKFDLPNHAQWEYAYRAGTRTEYYWGSGDSFEDVNPYAWYKENSGETTHEVGTKLPNVWGLHDMAGNVLEYMSHEPGDTPTFEAQVDPVYPDDPSEGMVCSGGFLSGSRRLKASSFSYIMATNEGTPEYAPFPFHRSTGIGFRLIYEPLDTAVNDWTLY